MKTQTETFTITASPGVMDRFKEFLELFHRASNSDQPISVALKADPDGVFVAHGQVEGSFKVRTPWKSPTPTRAEGEDAPFEVLRVDENLTAGFFMESHQYLVECKDGHVVVTEHVQGEHVEAYERDLSFLGTTPEETRRLLKSKRPSSWGDLENRFKEPEDWNDRYAEAKEKVREYGAELSREPGPPRPDVVPHEVDGKSVGTVFPIDQMRKPEEVKDIDNALKPIGLDISEASDIAKRAEKEPTKGQVYDTLFPAEKPKEEGDPEV